MENDFPTGNDDEPPPLDIATFNEEDLCGDHKALIWWIVIFSCVFQTLHSLSSRAISWLLMFLGSILLILGRFSNEISKVAAAFPSTLYKREQYLTDKLLISSIRRYVVCPSCNSINEYEHCLEHHSTRVDIKLCSECLHSRWHQHVPLLKQVITHKGNKKFYPFLVYPYSSLTESVRVLFKRPGFFQHCEQWRNTRLSAGSFCDVFDGKI